MIGPVVCGYVNLKMLFNRLITNILKMLLYAGNHDAGHNQRSPSTIVPRETYCRCNVFHS